MGTLSVLDPLRLLGDARMMSQAARWGQRWNLVAWRSDHADEFGRPAARNCGMPVTEEVVVTMTVSGNYHVSGIGRCRAVGSCPWCAPNIRAQRSRDIEALAEAALLKGLRVHMLTLTLPHSAEDGCRDSLDVLRDAWRRFRESRATRAVNENAGVIGMVKVVEATYGVNGWHWHLHVLVVSERRPDGLVDCWRGVWRSLGIEGQWVGKVSADLRAVRSASGIGSYLAKVEGGWGIGAELTRWSAKRARAKTSVSPAELLILAREYGEESPAYTAWEEYENATIGVRFIEWSRGLRKRAARWQGELLAAGHVLEGEDLGGVEKTDDEAAVADEIREQVAIMVAVPSRSWVRALSRGQAGLLVWSILCGRYESFGRVIDDTSEVFVKRPPRMKDGAVF